MSGASKLVLAIDVGNTNTVFGVFCDGKLAGDFRVETRRNRTEDEYYAMLEPMFRRAKLALQDVTDVVMASVVPPACKPISRFSELISGKVPFEVDYRVDLGLKLLYHRPEEMGADRVVNAWYAWKTYGAAIVVDFGTATTFDVVSNKGEYLGGCITPGIRISMDALFTYASRLPRIEVERPGNIIGRSTEEAMQSGVYFGYVAMVDGLVRRLALAAGFEPTVVATGGLAQLIARDSETVSVVEPDLTLLGLYAAFILKGGRGC